MTGMRHRGMDLPRQDLGLLGQAVVGQVAAEEQHVGLPAHPGQHVPHGRVERLRVMEVAYRRDPDRSVVRIHSSLLPSSRSSARPVPDPSLVRSLLSLLP